MALTKNEEKIYASVLADGKIHVSVPAGTEGAIVREYTTSDEKKGSKTEMVYTQLTGKITDIRFHEGDYGRNIQVTIVDGTDKPVVLSLSTSSSYGEDIMKKLMNVDMEKYVKIVPFSFTDTNGKGKKGITIMQKDDEGNTVKIKNYFYDEKAKKNIHGYPEPKKLKKPLSKDQWKLYFGEAREFLVETLISHFKIEDKAPEVADDDFDKAVNDFAKA